MFQIRDDNTYIAPTEIMLVCVDGDLYFPDNVMSMCSDTGNILLYRYPQGDYDTVKFPYPKQDQLLACLFDARECGDIASNCKVFLPNGEQVEF